MRLGMQHKSLQPRKKRSALNPFSRLPSLNLSLLLQEDLIEKLCKWVIDDEVHPVLKAFALGLLQKHIDGTDWAGSVASTDVPVAIVKRLTAAAQVIQQKSKPELKAKLAAEGKELYVKVPHVSPESDALKPPLEALHISNDLFRYRELVLIHLFSV